MARIFISNVLSSGIFDHGGHSVTEWGPIANIMLGVKGLSFMHDPKWFVICVLSRILGYTMLPILFGTSLKNYDFKFGRRNPRGHYFVR